MQITCKDTGQNVFLYNLTVLVCLQTQSRLSLDGNRNILVIRLTSPFNEHVAKGIFPSVHRLFKAN